MAVGRFINGIGALTWDPATERYLMLRRSGQRDFGGGHWECVTGRVDQGENFEQALHREVREEVGLEVQIEFLIATTHFYRGQARPENELLGLIYGCTLKGPADFSYSDEHSEGGWYTREEILAFLPERHWLRPVLQRLELLRRYTPPELRQEFQRQGFNIG